MCTNTCMECECGKSLLRRHSIHSPSCILRNVLTHAHTGTHTHKRMKAPRIRPHHVEKSLFHSKCFVMIWYNTLITGSDERPHHCSIPILHQNATKWLHICIHAQLQCSGGSVCTLWLKIDQRRQEERGKKRVGRSWEVEKKTKQGTTSTCPIQLRSLRAKIPF